MVERGPTDDAVVVLRMAAGSEAALETLYDRYGSAIFAAAYRLTSDRGTAEEVVQETFLVLWNRAETFDPETGIACARGCTRSPATGRSTGFGRPAAVRTSSTLSLGGRHRTRTPTQALERLASGGSVIAGRERAGQPRGRVRRRGAARGDPAERSRPCRRTSGRSSSWPTRRSSRRRRSPTDSAGRSARSRRGRAGRSCGCGAASARSSARPADAMMPVPAGEDR